MDKRKVLIEEFFVKYAERFNDAIKTDQIDVEGTVNAFAACFVEAGPAGVNCGANDQRFREALAQGYAYYRKIGITDMQIVTNEITFLDDYHNMAKVHWRSLFVRSDGSKGAIDFEVTYLLQTLKDQFKIFCYITGDEQKALKDSGLI